MSNQSIIEVLKQLSTTAKAQADAYDKAIAALERVLVPAQPSKSQFVAVQPPVVDPSMQAAIAAHAKALPVVNTGPLPPVGRQFKAMKGPAIPTLDGHPIPSSPLLASRAQRILKGRPK